MYELLFETYNNDNFLADLAGALNMRLSRIQGDAIRYIAKECDAQGIQDLRQFSYILATCRNECNFMPIEEIRAKEGTTIWKLQNRYWHTGFYGRGYSQLTWEGNYRQFGNLIGVDLVKYPAKALEPEIGAKILVTGMRRGMFRTKLVNRKRHPIQLEQFFTTDKADWIGARAVVNGTSSTEGKRQARKCAEFAEKIYSVVLKHAPQS